ncbi:GIY-YIG nuclease family protein [Gordonia sp. CPCC 205515]|uniref:GIY-YIG nuclease family protein n=1 Tax=Gordonia sp. CPCC 205515 TaxID=3140791 RepID=UPI003AF33B87
MSAHASGTTTRGRADGSTLRKSLGCLLADNLGIELRRYGSGAQRHFGAGEAVLDQWMADNALVSWITAGEPWELKTDFIAELDVPLNIDQNPHNAFAEELSETRRRADHRAKQLPVLPNPGRR